MDKRKLGQLEVSPIGMGCMGFSHGYGQVPPETYAIEAIRKAYDYGCTHFDTAEAYGKEQFYAGHNEELVGKAVEPFRKEVVLATKFHIGELSKPDETNLYREVHRHLEDSMNRLRTDYIDLYIIHRWDYTTPIEETMEALNDLVRMGKIRYIGASAMYAWQFVKANSIAEKNGWAKFISMQNMYNLVYREEEKEMIPMCQYENIALTPFSPLAHGVFNKAVDTPRTDGCGKLQNDYQLAHDREIIKRVYELAKKYQKPTSQIALAWVLSKPYITSPLVGSSKINYLEDALQALDIVLTPDEIAYLEEPYVPHNQYGFR